MTFTLYKPQTEAEWLELRTKVLTASDIAVLLGLDKYKSIKALVESKKSKGEPIDNTYLTLGQDLEPLVVKEVNRALSADFELVSSTREEQKFYADLDIGIGCTPDAFDGVKLLECKTTHPKNYIYWCEIPNVKYLIQLYSQMLTMDIKEGLLALKSTDSSIKSGTQSPDLAIHTLTREDWFDEAILTEVKKFWTCFKAGKQYRVNRVLEADVKLFFINAIKKVV